MNLPLLGRIAPGRNGGIFFFVCRRSVPLPPLAAATVRSRRYVGRRPRREPAGRPLPHASSRSRGNTSHAPALTLRPALSPLTSLFAQAANAGIVFKGKKKKNAQGVWEDAEETIDAWPEVLFIKPGSWAADDGFIKPGATLTSINGAAAPATFALAKDMLKAASEACSASNPFVELVWRAGAEEGVPPSEEISMPVRQWAVLSWNRRWIKFSGGLLSLYNCVDEPSADESPLIQIDVADPTNQIIADDLNPERARLDNGIALVHLKFAEAAQRTTLFDAIAQTAGAAAPPPAAGGGGGAVAAAAPKVQFDRKRYPFAIGKYWLGPMDPSKDWREGFEGGYGWVMAGINSETGERVCAKINHNIDFEGSAEQKKEIHLHADLKQENIVDLKDVLKEIPPSPPGRPKNKKPMLIMVMEIMAGGEMFAEVVDNGGLGMTQARSYARQILLGLAYCHKRSIAHRDIKLENLLLSADRKTCKIADFGLAKIATGGMDMTVIGTIKCGRPPACPPCTPV